MFDHLSLAVKDVNKSKAFYDKTLKPLGLSCVMQFPGAVGYGPSIQAPVFWIQRPSGRAAPKGTAGAHLAFHCGSRTKVDAFYSAAIKAGAKDNGKPGVRKDYHPNYYGAFVIDSDGNRLEAVCHRPPKAKAKAAKRR
ncbi:MAG: VOC family protein [Alphaproteobacteria bacterium]|nr:VOC family protein [Alphaproteobacteria bacterium]